MSSMRLADIPAGNYFATVNNAAAAIETAVVEKIWVQHRMIAMARNLDPDDKSWAQNSDDFEACASLIESREEAEHEAAATDKGSPGLDIKKTPAVGIGAIRM